MHRYAVSTRDKNVDHAGADTINLRLKRSSKLTANSSFDGILKRLSIRGGAPSRVTYPLSKPRYAERHLL